MAGYWNSPDLTFFSGGKQTAGWQATLDRYRATYASPGHEMGTLEFSGLRIEMLGPDAAFVRGAMASDHARWQDSARAVHVDIPQVAGRVEDCARSHLGGGMKVHGLKDPRLAAGSLALASRMGPWTVRLWYLCLLLS